MVHEDACLAHLKEQGVPILNFRDIDRAEGGANHIDEVCDAA